MIKRERKKNMQKIAQKPETRMSLERERERERERGI